MKLFAFTRYDETGASSRIRFYAVKEYFVQEGLELEIYPLLPSPYLARKYARQHLPLKWIFGRYIGRMKKIFSLQRSSRPWLWVEYELFPWLPGWFEGWLTRHFHVILDYDDAIFHRYDQHPHPLVRSMLGNKIASLVSQATGVTVCNAYLEEFARAHGCPRIHRYPSSVDLDIYTVRPSSSIPKRMVVGWLGSPSTSRYLLDLYDVVVALKNEPIRWLFVGVNPEVRAKFAGLPVEFADWSLDQEVSLLHRMDVGIMPLPETPWTRGKCGYKLIQYMAVGIPVVASPVGINVELALPGETGFLASTSEQWVHALRTLLNNPHLREEMGRKGRRLVEQNFSLETNARKLARTFLAWMEELGETSS